MKENNKCKGCTDLFCDPVKMQKPKRNNSCVSMMLFITIPLGTSRSFKFSVCGYCTSKSMPGNLWKKLKWGFLQVEFVVKKHCKIPFYHRVNRDTGPLFVFLHTKGGEKKKKPREPLWYSGQYMNTEKTAAAKWVCGKRGEAKPGYFKITEVFQLTSAQSGFSQQPFSWVQFCLGFIILVLGPLG